jgi:quinol-cytochrome oxidoreductase complex cytochrome b subunit/mono/diheme cytochrome c family protein
MKSPLLPSPKSSTSQSGLARGLFFACLTGMLLLVGWWSYGVIETATSPQATSTLVPPTPASNAARLTKPILTAPQNPTQLDQGALVYWGVCMACHGDRGEGLTNEWRAVYGEDQNCWASKCHASNHPPQGFVIPRDRLPPAVDGPGKLARFNTAQELYNYIVVTMPWWKPGSLTPEKAWALTAYILKLNGSLPQGIVLDATDASAIPVHHLVTASQNDQTGELVLAALLVLVAVVMILQTTAKRKAAVALSDEAISLDAPVSARSRPNFLYHLHPPTIPAPQARWRYTLGTGGLAIFLSLVLLVTGILEMFYYVPQSDRATISIQTIAHFVPYGGLIRNLHYWGAQALVIVLFIHLFRIAMTGAYKQPRRFNYLLGLTLLFLTLALDFTGYILRWDQGTSWALVVGTNLIKTIPGIGNQLYEFAIGGVQLGSAALIRFYSWHTFGLTLAMIIIVIWHIFRIRRDGGIAVPPPALRQSEERISRFELVRREMLLMTVAAIVLVLLSIFWPAPITPPLTSTTADLNNARAPWFFLWVQQLLKFGDPFFLGVMVPLIILAILILIPYIFPKPSDSELGRWFPKGGRVVQILITILTLLLIGLTIWAILPAT